MRRLEFVDCLRGLAALYVVVYHMTLLPNPNLAVPDTLQMLVMNGGTAVTLFFVVSAFSLCHTLLPHLGKPGAVRDFYIRRLFRIAPLFYAVLVFYAAFQPTFRAPAGEWLKSILFVFNFFPGSEQGIVMASWTIGVEMVFYAVFPFLFARYRSPPSLIALMFGALLLQAFCAALIAKLPIDASQQQTFHNISFLRHLPVFIIGMLCWLIYHRFLHHSTCPPAVGSAILLGTVWGFYALFSGALTLGFPDPYYWQAILYSGLLLGSCIHPSAVLVNRLTAFAGRISYSTYLLHPMFIVWLIPVYRHIYSCGLPTILSFGGCAIVTYACLLIAATVTFHLIEQPGMLMGKRLLIRLSGVPAVPRANLTT